MARSSRPPSRGDRLFAELTAHLRQQPGIEEGRMLHSTGLKIDTKFFAFVGTDDRLIVKLPAEHAHAMIAKGNATPVTMGTRTMKEWIALPFPADPGDAEDNAWASAIEEALAYVSTVPKSTRRRR